MSYVVSKQTAGRIERGLDRLEHEFRHVPQKDLQQVYRDRNARPPRLCPHFGYKRDNESALDITDIYAIAGDLVTVAIGGVTLDQFSPTPSTARWRKPSTEHEDDEGEDLAQPIRSAPAGQYYIGTCAQAVWVESWSFVAPTTQAYGKVSIQCPYPGPRAGCVMVYPTGSYSYTLRGNLQYMLGGVDFDSEGDTVHQSYSTTPSLVFRPFYDSQTLRPSFNEADHPTGSFYLTHRFEHALYQAVCASMTYEDIDYQDGHFTNGFAQIGWMTDQGITGVAAPEDDNRREYVYVHRKAYNVSRAEPGVVLRVGHLFQPFNGRCATQYGGIPPLHTALAGHAIYFPYTVP